LDIKGARTVGVIVDFLHLWDLLYNFELEPDVEDVHIWRFSASGQYSAKSAYESFFLGSTQFGPYERIWNTWARPNAVFSFGWWPTIGVGRQIALHVVGCLILSSALSVTRRMRLLTTS